MKYDLMSFMLKILQFQSKITSTLIEDTTRTSGKLLKKLDAETRTNELLKKD